MEAQQIYDTVVNSLRQQGSKSFLSEEQIKEYGLYNSGVSPMCAYRGPHGEKCAAGTLITDEEYSPTMEGIGIGVILKSVVLPFTIVDSLRNRLGSHWRLIEDLQWVHDRIDVSDWEHHWQRVAREYNLIYTEPNATHSQASPDNGS